MYSKFGSLRLLPSLRSFVTTTGFVWPTCGKAALASEALILCSLLFAGAPQIQQEVAEFAKLDIRAILKCLRRPTRGGAANLHNSIEHAMRDHSNAWSLTLSWAGDVEHMRLGLEQPRPDRSGRGVNVTIKIDNEMGLARLLRDRDRLCCSAIERAAVEHKGRVAVGNVLPSALSAARRSPALFMVSERHRAELSEPVAPSASH